MVVGGLLRLHSWWSRFLVSLPFRHEHRFTEMRVSMIGVHPLDPPWYDLDGRNRQVRAYLAMSMLQSVRNVRLAPQHL